MFEHLPWDSDFFRLHIGRAEVAGDFQVSELPAGYDLVYLLAQPEDAAANHSLKSAGAVLVDEKVTYVKDVDSRWLAGDEHIVSYRRQDLAQDEAVIALGLQSGIYSRFKIDQRLPEDAFRRLYRRWMERSIDRTMAEDVLVYLDGFVPLGVLTLGQKQGRADIGILAVDEHARGRHIGRKLVATAVEQSSGRALAQIQVVTQKANQTACRFYEKNGFAVESVRNVYHLWRR